MNGRHVRIFVLSLISACMFLRTIDCDSQEAMAWRYAPAYESASDVKASRLAIKDETGNERVMYDASFAVLIVEERYTNGWSSPTTEGQHSEALLVKALEKRGFHVLVWRDLTGEKFLATLDDILGNIGYRDDNRLFFYYFGHGTVQGTPDDDQGPRTFLVPTDAPDQSKDLPGFYKTAVPISRLTEMASEMTLKHAFFALEACKAGGILSSLSAPPPPNPMGYIYGATVKKPVRQFLTAGNAQEDVPPGAFTALVVGALEEGDRNKKGYVTGSDVIAYVSQNAPQYSTAFPLDPAYGSIPHSGGGDMIMSVSSLPLSKSAAISSSGAEQVVYRSCRLAENGIESWQHEAPWASNSGWMGGGNNQPTVCNGLIAGWQAGNPGHLVTLNGSSETSKKDILGHVEYMYFCTGVERANPIYKEARSSKCGVETTSANN